MARPITTSYSPAERQRIANYLCEQLLMGRGLFKTLKLDREKEKLCSPAQWAKWQREDATLAEQVARAREAACERLIEETIEIADNKKEDPHSRRVRIQARKDAAAMLAPRRFGQKLDVTSGGEKLPAPVTLQDNRIQTLLAIAASRMAQGQALEAETLELTAEPSITDVMS